MEVFIDSKKAAYYGIEYQNGKSLKTIFKKISIDFEPNLHQSEKGLETNYIVNWTLPIYLMPLNKKQTEINKI